MTVNSYRVIEAADTATLEKDVMAAIKQGWQPQGGVAVFRYVWTDRHGDEECEWMFAQALVLPDVGA